MNLLGEAPAATGMVAPEWRHASPGGHDYQILKDFGQLQSLLLSRLAVAAHDDPADGESIAAAEELILDAFLAAAGMHQTLQDYLQRDAGDLKKVASRLTPIRPPLGRLAAAAVGSTSSRLQQLRWAASEHRLVLAEGHLRGLVESLAAAVLERETEDEQQIRARALHSDATDVVASLRNAAALRHTISRLPACFYSFDQQPEDSVRLADAFAAEWPDRARPLLVVGVRTSGSYLAPLHASALRARGYQLVEVCTWRSGNRWLPDDRQRIAAIAEANGLALLTDDPPASGGTLAEAARELERVGIPRSRIVALLQLFDSPDWWPWRNRLAGLQSVTLPWDRWVIQDRLAPEAVEAVLRDLLVGGPIPEAAEVGGAAGGTVGAVTQVIREPLPGGVDRPSRGHVRARYRVVLHEQETGRRFVLRVYVKGTGLGYFASQALEVARRLPDFFPATLGGRNGLLYRAWLPEGSRRAAQPDSDRLAARVVDYVVARHRSLPVSADSTLRLGGRGPGWQRCSEVFGPAFGRLAPLLRPILHRAFRTLMHSPHPSLPDGNMAASDWFDDPAGRIPKEAIKVAYDEGAFLNQAPQSYDPVSDLAVAALQCGSGERHPGEPRFGRELRRRYLEATGVRVDDERWLLYQLLHVITRHQVHLRYEHTLAAGPDRQVPQSAPPERSALLDRLLLAEEELASLHQRYLGDRYLSDVEPPLTGPLCAVDIDGVLETGWLGFPSTTPAGGAALRALARHGYRVVLATGRSLEDVRRRCHAYRLAGGVAEYGAVWYEHATGRERSLLEPQDHVALEAMRRALCEIPGVVLDRSHRYAIRAYRLESGWRRGLDDESIMGTLERAGVAGLIRPVRGWSQTDFIVSRIDKGVGVRALAGALMRASRTATDAPLLALAVGDAAPDLPMFELAERSFAPANADASLRRLATEAPGRLSITRKPYQAGLLEAVSSLLGHRPEGCRLCRPPRFDGAGAVIMAILAAQDAGKWGKVGRALELAVRTARLERAHA